MSLKAKQIMRAGGAVIVLAALAYGILLRMERTAAPYGGNSAGGDPVIFEERNMPREGVATRATLYDSGKLELTRYDRTISIAEYPDKLDEAKKLIRAIIASGCTGEKQEGPETSAEYVFSLDGKTLTIETPRSCPELEKLRRLVYSFVE